MESESLRPANSCMSREALSICLSQIAGFLSFLPTGWDNGQRGLITPLFLGVEDKDDPVISYSLTKNFLFSSEAFLAPAQRLQTNKRKGKTRQVLIKRDDER